MKSLNLFGEMQEIPDIKSKHQSAYQIIKARNKYGLAKNKTESCKNCIHCFGIIGNTKTYYKCKLIGNSAGEATDIRLKNSCNKFIPEKINTK